MAEQANITIKNNSLYDWGVIGMWLAYPLLERMNPPMTPTPQLASRAAAEQNVPRTADGKRNWSWSAVHPGQQKPSAQTVPEAEGSFWDFVDIINPLQHIPIISTVYRAVTGDSISAPARVLGGLLFGGPAGMLAGTAGAVMAATNLDPASRLLANITQEDSASLQASAPTDIIRHQVAGQLYSKAARL